MANTKDLKIITDFAIKQLSNELRHKLTSKKVLIGISSDGTSRFKKFDGVSDDGEIVVALANNSGYTSGGKKPTGKIRSVFALCYFLSLTQAKRKILILTDSEFYNIFQKESDGLLNGIELRYVDLPHELKEIAKRVKDNASREMS